MLENYICCHTVNDRKPCSSDFMIDYMRSQLGNIYDKTLGKLVNALRNIAEATIEILSYIYDKTLGKLVDPTLDKFYSSEDAKYLKIFMKIYAGFMSCLYLWPVVFKEVWLLSRVLYHFARGTIGDVFEDALESALKQEDDPAFRRSLFYLDIKFALFLGANPHIIDYDQDTPLFQAVIIT